MTRRRCPRARPPWAKGLRRGGGLARPSKAWLRVRSLSLHSVLHSYRAMPAGLSSSASAQYRFVFTRTRAQESEHEKPELQLSAVDLYDDDGLSILIPGTVASNPLGSTANPHQTVGMAIDHRVETKWLDSRFQANNHKSILELKLPAAQHPIASCKAWAVEPQKTTGLRFPAC